MALDRCINIDDLRRAARRRLPSVLFDYIEGGAEDEQTMRWNQGAFAQHAFVPRVLRDVTDVDLSTSVAGVPMSMPLITAPMAMMRLFHHEGELGMARAAKTAGIPFALSTVATTSLEDVAATGANAFFQLYIWRDRDIVYRLLDRCEQAGYRGLMLAVDMAAFGKRERDLHHGHGHARRLRLNTALSALPKPRWLYHYLRSSTLRIANMIDVLPDGGNAMTTIDSVNAQFDPGISWRDVEALRKRWSGPFYLKGIQSVDDAMLARDLGVTGIVLSNHGGRQLDGAPATFDLLQQVAAATGGDMEILLDGGIRRGSDVIKAIACGAHACLVGRSALYGLAAGGEAGAAHSLAILRDEMTRVMRLIGCTRLDQLGPHVLQPVSHVEKLS